MKSRYDVIVAGAGPSGIAAAIAAAREGARVLLVEGSGILGGMNTAALVCPLMGFHAGEKQVVRGFAQEIIDRLMARGASRGHLSDPLGVASTITPIEPTALKQVYFEMVAGQPGLDLLLLSFLCEARTSPKGISEVVCVNKSGRNVFSASTFIDATGDGDLMALAGAAYTEGRPADGLAQPMTLLFKLSGVDLDRVRAEMSGAPEQFILRKRVDLTGYVAVSGFFDAVRCAREAGDFSVERDRVLFFQGTRPDEVFVNMTRVTRCRGTNGWELSHAEQEARAQVDEILAFLRKYVPGFAGAVLAETGDCIGVRESRRLKGEYTLTEQDILAGRRFDDSVAMCAFPIDIHDPAGKDLRWVKTNEPTCYDVPYRVMLPQAGKPGNLLVTGRCVSATHEAVASVRITPTAMALGEAAGIAAALSLGHAGRCADVEVEMLQARIASHGGVPGRRWLD